MLRHAIAPSRDYLKAPHAIVRHSRLNNDAKMLLLYVLGLPESRCGKPLGEHAARLGIKPRAYQKAKALLVECGFLREDKRQNERGRWVTEQVVTNDVAVSPSVRFSAVGDSTDRVVGGSPTEDEEQEKKNTPHPPPEPGPGSELGPFTAWAGEGEGEGGGEGEVSYEPPVGRADVPAGEPPDELRGDSPRQSACCCRCVASTGTCTWAYGRRGGWWRWRASGCGVGFRPGNCGGR